MVLALGWLSVAAIAADDYDIIYSFGGTASAGVAPLSALSQDGDGVLYGTTASGGKGQGIVYSYNPRTKTMKTLHAFTGGANDGASPHGGALLLSQGLIYGTTAAGGAADKGTLYVMKQDGSGFSLLHSFGVKPRDGVHPQASLTQVGTILYGTTFVGGGSQDNGVIFKYDLTAPSSGVTVLHEFGDVPDPALPLSGLWKGTDGGLYGLAQFGGMKVGKSTGGAVFRFDPAAGGVRTLHAFGGGPTDGTSPFGNVVQDDDGVLYGTTGAGGSFPGTVGIGLGTAFRVNMDGSGYSVLRSFGAVGNGSIPCTGLIFGTDGALYGTTQAGGTSGKGALFRMDRRSGAISVLHSFGSFTGDAMNAGASLLQADDGSFYGTGADGGNYGKGAIFRLSAYHAFVQGALDEMGDLRPTATQRIDEGRITAAIAVLARAASPGWWLGHGRPVDEKGSQVFAAIEESIELLNSVAARPKTPVDRKRLSACVDGLVKTSRFIAMRAIHDAMEAKVEAAKLSAATQALARADASRARLAGAEAVKDYATAWSLGLRAAGRTVVMSADEFRTAGERSADGAAAR